jgi:hypothetical protein
MNVFTIEPESSAIFPLAPVTGVVVVRVAASDKVDVFAFDADSKEQYAKGDGDAPALAKSLGGTEHTLAFNFPTPTSWFLVVENTSNNPLSGSFSVAASTSGSLGAVGASGATGAFLPYFPGMSSSDGRRGY